MSKESAKQVEDMLSQTHANVLRTDNVVSNHKDLHFKGQQVNEELVCFFRCHWVSLIPNLILFLLFALITLSIFIVFMTSIEFRNQFFALQLIFLFFFVFSTFYLHKFFLRLISHFAHVIIVTNSRIIEIHKTVYLNNSLDSIDLRLIEDVSKKQRGLIKNILNYGELIITLSDFSQVISWVPNPDFHFRVINRVMQAAKSGSNANFRYLQTRKKTYPDKRLENL